MLKLSKADIIEKIHASECFECEINDGSFTLKIENYVPSICTAIHAGHRLRSKLIPQCLLNAEERYYEEDPHTQALIQAMPITLVGLDSRYEYDLNRPVANCIYQTAWGKKVWQKKLSNKEISISVEKHQTFYQVLDALVQVLEKKFGSALIFDVHSYNYLRREDETPTFNLGTEQINLDKWQAVVNHAQKQLGKIVLPNMPVTAKQNSVFYGRGYMISHINSRFQHCLVLPLEVKKIFMDELTGELYPLVMEALLQQFKYCLTETAALFSKRYTRKVKVSQADMLAEKMDSSIIKLDRALYQLAKGMETLYYINPINIESERKQFFKKNGNYQPNFHYHQLNIDPFKFREQLYRLPVETIRDPSIQSLYRDVINSLSDKVSLLVNAGRPQFLYESLKYYGEPSQTDKKNAEFLLHATQYDVHDGTHIDTDTLMARFKEQAQQWDMKCKIETSNKLVAAAMVSHSKKAVIVAKGLTLTDTEAQALINHELGVHMATTLNANQQRLKVFSLGLPGNTFTQEGLAILNEYQSGNMTLHRLQGLAHRVLAVNEMLNEGDFRHTYSYLHEELQLPANNAFKLTVRVHRGGGFTKDYLYLSGVSKALALYKHQDIRNLYVGKTGFNYLDTINEMIERQLITSPSYYPSYIYKPVATNPVLEYLMSCIHSSKRPNTSTVLAA